MSRFEFQVKENFHRRRLDEFLFNEFRSMSKAYLRRIVKEGNCEVNGYIENSGKIIKRGDFLEIVVDIDQEKGMKPEEISIDVIYEDKEILVVNKPTGLLVHPTNFERNGTLLNGLTHYLNRNSSPEQDFIRPHLIHRLDRETSGLMVIATNSSSSKKLCEHFKRKLFEKKYMALLDGIVTTETGVIDAPIGRFEELRKWDVKEDGKLSESRFRVLKRFSVNTLVELEAVTGRTNQLRIHSASIGHPITGDEKYGGTKFERMCLHASRLCFWHPNGGERLEFEIDCPDSFKSATV